MILLQNSGWFGLKTIDEHVCLTSKWWKDSSLSHKNGGGTSLSGIMMVEILSSLLLRETWKKSNMRISR